MTQAGVGGVTNEEEYEYTGHAEYNTADSIEYTEYSSYPQSHCTPLDILHSYRFTQRLDMPLAGAVARKSVLIRLLYTFMVLSRLVYVILCSPCGLKSYCRDDFKYAQHKVAVSDG